MEVTYVGLHPLVVSCLSNYPELRPLHDVMSEQIMRMKICSKNTNHDRMDSLSWLAEMKQPSMDTGLRNKLHWMFLLHLIPIQDPVNF